MKFEAQVLDDTGHVQGSLQKACRKLSEIREVSHPQLRPLCAQTNSGISNKVPLELSNYREAEAVCKPPLAPVLYETPVGSGDSACALTSYNKATDDSPCSTGTALRNRCSLIHLCKATERFCRSTKLRGCGSERRGGDGAVFRQPVTRPPLTDGHVGRAQAALSQMIEQAHRMKGPPTPSSAFDVAIPQRVVPRWKSFITAGAI